MHGVGMEPSLLVDSADDQNSSAQSARLRQKLGRPTLCVDIDRAGPVLDPRAVVADGFHRADDGHRPGLHRSNPGRTWAAEDPPAEENLPPERGSEVGEQQRNDSCHAPSHGLPVDRRAQLLPLRRLGQLVQRHQTFRNATKAHEVNNEAQHDRYRDNNVRPSVIDRPPTSSPG